MEKLKVLELFSGIGGMHFALKMAEFHDAQVVAAVDINPNANLVYKHNFPKTNIIQKTIEGIKLEEYEKFEFDMILMSPPCQPFTRQGNQLGTDDTRVQSFLSLIDLIPKFKKKPKYILMENVKGFDEDKVRKTFIEMLKSQKYHFQEFLLSPIQFGIPNSRLRYFLIARHNNPFRFEITQDIRTDLPKEGKKFINEIIKKLNFDLNKCEIDDQKKDKYPEPLISYIKPSQINEDYRNCNNSEFKHIFVDEPMIMSLAKFVSNRIGSKNDLFLSNDMFFKSVNLMDLVTVSSTRTSCFTKNYGRYLEGTGSIFKVTNQEDWIQNDKGESIECNRNMIRFFSPKEIANLHCFPNEFEFPQELSTLQRWRLIGNSLNVVIVAVLLKLTTL